MKHSSTSWDRPARYTWAFMLLLVFAGLSGACYSDLPGIILCTSITDNTITLSVSSGGTANVPFVPLTAGGTVSTLLVASFGQPFAGAAFYPDADTSLDSSANNLCNGQAGERRGALFLSDPSIYKEGIVGVSGDTSLLDAKYSQNDLDAALDLYRRALLIDPFDEKALQGILFAQQAQVLENNLLSDIDLRAALRKRLTSTQAGDVILSGEIAILEGVAARQKTNVALLLDLMRDDEYRGVGALLRHDATDNSFSADSEKAAVKTVYLMFTSVRRLCEAELDIAKKKVLRDFFQDNSRETAVTDLQAASAYVTEFLRLMGPYVPTDLSILGELGKVTSLESTMDSLASQIRQGYNVFGFLPDFVPFFAGTLDDKNLSTFSKIYAVADTACTTASTRESTASSSETTFAQTQASFLQRVNDTKTTYEERLKTLIGTATYSDGTEEPDLLTYLMPDVDTDDDGISERDALRSQLAAKYKITFGPKGRLGEQYKTMQNATDRVQSALNDMSNNVQEIDIREKTAETIFGIHQEIATLIKDDGTKEAALTREKGRLQKEAAEAMARAQKKSHRFGSIVGAITAPISGALSGLASGGPIGAAAGAGAGAVNGVGGLITSASDCRCIMKCGGIQGQLAMDLANIDAQVIEIQSMERATIEIKNGEIELARDEQEVKLLMLKQANLELNIRMAERDESREEMALSDILGEASTVASDMVRALSFARNDAQFGWNDSDVRDVLTNNALKANESFNRAQAWAFVALRALEYYADLPPDVSTGLPNQLIQNLYTELYQTRTAQNLRDLLTAMKINNDTSFVFSASTASCPGRGILSLKYDVVVPTLLMSNFDASGQPPDGAVEGESDYKYRDPQTGEILQGARAYQGAFREFLHRSLSGTRGNRILRLVFATDLYRRRSSGSADASNPFELDAVRAKITGFDVQDCGGVGTVPNVQGIQVDFTGNIPTASKAPALTVQQSGNSYVKHSKWVVDSITGKIKDPWKSLRVYSAYKQLLPVWLASDIDQSASEPMDGGSQMEIGSEVISEEFSPLLNGLNGGNLSTKTRAFTDRSVANDHWELVLKDTSDTYTEKFLDSVQAMLDKTVSDPASDDFLTDIELWIGWSYKGY